MAIRNGSFSVMVPSSRRQAPLHSPWQVDSHRPMQFAGSSGVPSQ
jgi:hypothetical protein